MERKIKQVYFPIAKPPQAKRVAAYSRVSSGKDAMLHSLSAQVSHYSELIQNHRGWQYCGVFADEAITGTKEARDGFQRLLAECRAGNIDMVITKSISRFARNTVTLLDTIRELKLLGVDVYFEEQNIHTIGTDGELILTILASYAQEESRSTSENMKWRIKKNFEEGTPWNGTVLGYYIEDGQYQIIPKEAEIVKRIFSDYLGGLGCEAIAKRLNDEDIPSPRGIQWSFSTVHRMLNNYSYTGNLLLQQTFRDNHITKKYQVNRGELPMYHATETHDAIIPQEVFDAVRQEAANRAERYRGETAPHKYPFSSKLVCMGCGKRYRRKTKATKVVWACSTFDKKGKAACSTSKQVSEEILIDVTTQVLGLEAFDADQFERTIQEILVGPGNTLRYIFRNGNVVDTIWQAPSRASSWTPEMKQAARQREIERKKQICQKQ